MTQLYKKNGAVFIHVGITVEEVERLKEKNAELQEELVGLRLKVETLEGKTPWKDIKDKSEVIGKLIKAKELIEELSSSLSVVGECDDEECELLNRAEQFLKDSEVEK